MTNETLILSYQLIYKNNINALNQFAELEYFFIKIIKKYKQKSDATPLFKMSAAERLAVNEAGGSGGQTDARSRSFRAQSLTVYSSVLLMSLGIGDKRK